MISFSTIDRTENSYVLMLGDHAGRLLPDDVGTLGMAEKDLFDHIAFDPGVMEALCEWSENLGVSVVAGRYSRLYVDLNRDPKDPTVISSISDRRIIPGNVGLDDAQIKHRLDRAHEPYHQAVAQFIERILTKHGYCLILSLHSFTPFWRDQKRPTEVGLLHASPPSWLYGVETMLREKGFVAGINEPYHGDLPGDCMSRHAVGRHEHVLIEIRNDLLQDRAWRKTFTGYIDSILSTMQQARQGEVK
ncbi:MAG: N-formylglutamate amidohydrolase [Alphaproteobacteria bacterium]